MDEDFFLERTERFVKFKQLVENEQTKNMSI